VKLKKKTNFCDFNLLNIHEKADVINNEGSFVRVEYKKSRKKTLFQVNAFYAEVTYTKKGIIKIKTLSAQTEL
jgi:hypothetical protein